MAGFDVVFRARRVITAAGEVARCVGVRDGRIAAIEPYDSDLTGDSGRVVEVGPDEVLLPGLVDTHVHVNEPGRTEWEGFATATRAAAAGGVTTIVDMPLNSIPPTVDVEALDIKRKAAEGQVWSTSGSGAAPSRATPTSCAACTTPGCSASSASCCTPGWTSSRTSTPDELEEALREVRVVRRADDRARRGLRRDRPAPRAATGQRYGDFLALAARAAPRTSRSPRSSSWPGGPAAGCTSCTCPARTRCP